MLLKNELVCSSPTKGSKHGLKGVCKEGLCFKASYELLKWEKPKLSMSAFDFQYIFTLNWGVSHPSLPKALPNSTNSNFPVPQGHPHCTDFHRLFPEVWFTFLKVTEVPSKKKKGQFQRQLANSPSLQPGHCSWVTTNWAPEQILSFIFKKRTSSRLSRTGCFNSIKLCSKRNVCATGMTHPTWKGLHHQPHLPQEKKILRNVPSD